MSSKVPHYVGVKSKPCNMVSKLCFLGGFVFKSLHLQSTSTLYFVFFSGMDHDVSTLCGGGVF